MGKVEGNFAEALHQTGINPISISGYKDEERGYLEINLLTQETIDQVANIILDESFKSFELKSTDQKKYEIIDKKAIIDFKLSAIFVKIVSDIK